MVAEPEPMFAMGRAEAPKLLGYDDIPDLPAAFANVIGGAKRHEAISEDGW